MPIFSEQSGFAPLRHRLFLIIWGATVLGNIGTFIRDVGSAWLMTDLSPSPLATSLIQAAATLPIFLLAIPAGVLSDILDRRKLLIAIQCLLAFVSLSLMLLSLFDLQSVSSLILLTFLGGIGAALAAPSWQAIVPELIDKNQLKNAVALNSLGINIARAIGPALGGVILASLGVVYAYGTDFFSYIFVILALLYWQRPVTLKSEISENFGGALKAGLRYVKSSKEMHILLGRAFVFFIIASAIWALLPLIARKLLGGTAGFYGLLLGSIGAGAIIGALLLPKLRAIFTTDKLIISAAFIMAFVMCGLVLFNSQTFAILFMLLLGGAWITALTLFNSTAQSILPNWVRGRSLAIYLTVFNGAMTLGSLLWGSLAQWLGISAILLIAAILIIAITLFSSRVKLPEGQEDLSPSQHWADISENNIEADRGPVLVQIEYRINPQDKNQFLNAIYALSVERRKDGAYQWSIAEDEHDENRLIEWFLVESWGEHLRQHQRVSKQAQILQNAVNAFHQGKQPPKVKHYVGLTKIN